MIAIYTLLVSQLATLLWGVVGLRRHFGALERSESLREPGDRGQRYEVTYNDGTGRRRTFGWSHDLIGVDAMRRAIIAHRQWHSPVVTDRQNSEQSA